MSKEVFKKNKGGVKLSDLFAKKNSKGSDLRLKNPIESKVGVKDQNVVESKEKVLVVDKELKKTVKHVFKKKVSKKEKVVNVKKDKKKEERVSENSEIKTPSLFKFIQADGVGNKLLLLSFIKWIAHPKSIRMPKTHIEFGAKFGVSIDTLTDWKKLIGFYDEVSMYHYDIMRRFTPEVANGIAKAAIKGNPKAQELYYKIFEKFSDKISFKDETLPIEIEPREQEAIDRALRNIGLASIIQKSKKDEQAV